MQISGYGFKMQAQTCQHIPYLTANFLSTEFAQKILIPRTSIPPLPRLLRNLFITILI